MIWDSGSSSLSTPGSPDKEGAARSHAGKTIRRLKGARHMILPGHGSLKSVEYEPVGTAGQVR